MGYQFGSDTLSFTANPALYGDLDGRFDPLNWAMTLSSNSQTVTAAQLQAALRSVVFSTTSLSTSNRNFSFDVYDSSWNYSNLLNETAYISFVTNAAPIVTASGGSGQPPRGDPVVMLVYDLV